MKIFVFAILFASTCFCKTLPEEDSVVSVYTTQATTSGTSNLDVYQQIANNLAERISSPFYRLFGVERNKTKDTKRPSNIELLDDPSPTKFKDDNEIGYRDVEEMSIEALRTIKNKPEKLTLYNSYLPINEKLEQNDTLNDIDSELDDELTLDDVDSSVREGPFIYVMELIGSLIQLVWGAVSALFGSSRSSDSDTESGA